MSETKRRRFSASYKAKVAEAAIRERESTAELAQRHRVHSNQVSQWKRQGLAGLQEAFKSPLRESVSQRQREAVLLAKIGQLQIKIDELEGRLPDVRG